MSQYKLVYSEVKVGRLKGANNLIITSSDKLLITKEPIFVATQEIRKEIIEAQMAAVAIAVNLVQSYSTIANTVTYHLMVDSTSEDALDVLKSLELPKSLNERSQVNLDLLSKIKDEFNRLSTTNTSSILFIVWCVVKINPGNQDSKGDGGPKHPRNPSGRNDGGNNGGHGTPGNNIVQFARKAPVAAK